MTVRVLILEDDVWAVTPAGRIDVAAARALEDAINGLLDQGHGRVVVDLSETIYISSGGLRVLFLALRRARTFGGDLHLAAMGDNVREIFRVAGFDALFAIHPSAAEAAQSLRAA